MIHPYQVAYKTAWTYGIKAHDGPLRAFFDARIHRRSHFDYPRMSYAGLEKRHEKPSFLA